MNSLHRAHPVVTLDSDDWTHPPESGRKDLSKEDVSESHTPLSPAPPTPLTIVRPSRFFEDSPPSARISIQGQPSHALHLNRFWEEWSKHRDSLRSQIDEYCGRQENLIRSVLLGVHPAHSPPANSNEGTTSATAARFITSRSSTGFTVDSPRLPPGPRISQISDASYKSRGGTWPATARTMEFARATTDQSAISRATARSSRESGHQPARDRFLDTYHKMKREDLSAHARDRWASTISMSMRFQGTNVNPDVPPVLVRLLDAWHSLKEPPRRGWLADFILNRYFDLFVSFVILANAIYTAWQANNEMNHLDAESSQTPLDMCFVIFYTVELMAKIAVHRLYFFCNSDMAWNLFDFGLVLFSLGDMVLMSMDPGFSNVTFARSLRLFKMGKVLRIFRAMRLMKELRVMLASIVGSVTSLFWSFIMIGVVKYIVALFFMQQMSTILAHAAANDLLDEAPYNSQRVYFRSVERTVLSLMEATMGGLDWDVIYKTVEPLGWIYILAFIFYIAFFNFAVLNILTGIFVENAMKLCKPERSEAFQMQREQRDKDEQELRRIVHSMNLLEEGRICKEEFLAMATLPEVVRCFATIGVDVSNPIAFFRLISMPEGVEVFGVEDFVQRTLAVRASLNSGIDLSALMMKSLELQQTLEQIRFQELRELELRMDLVRGSQIVEEEVLSPRGNFDTRSDENDHDNDKEEEDKEGELKDRLAL